MMKRRVRLTVCLLLAMALFSVPVLETEAEEKPYKQPIQVILSQLAQHSGTMEYTGTGVSFPSRDEAVDFIEYFYRNGYWGQEKVLLAVMNRSDEPDVHQIGILTSDAKKAIRQHWDVEAVLQAAALQIEEQDISSREKAELAYQWVYGQLEYDYELKNLDLYTSLMTGKSVCYGFASSFHILCGMLGLESEMVYGANHVWNRVKIDNEWQYVDITWNKNLGEHRFLFLKEEKWKKVHPLAQEAQ